MHDDNDLRESWEMLGRAVGYVLTVAGGISIILMLLAILSLWLGSSPVR